MCGADSKYRAEINAYWATVGKDEGKRPVVVQLGIDGRIIFK
jgi:hypothetical protein